MFTLDSDYRALLTALDLLKNCQLQRWLARDIEGGYYNGYLAAIDDVRKTIEDIIYDHLVKKGMVKEIEEEE